jgi:phosphonate transport system ATP-binding protein
MRGCSSNVTFDLQGVTVRHRASTGQNAGVLSDLTLSIGQGEQVALIGPSGAGKTTLLHTLACAHRPESGTFKVFDTDPWSLGNAERHTLRSRLFLAPQTPPLPPRQRVVTAVLAGRLPQWSFRQALWSLLRPADTDMAFEALARFDLQDKLYARVDRLSGGERQRCGMARLLVSSAQAFLVDEPLSALDPTLALRTLGVLLQEVRSRRATIVCSLHQVDLAREHFPRIIGLRDGRIAFDAAREQVTDEMIKALYRNTSIGNPDLSSPDQAEALLHPPKGVRCF